MNDSPSVPLNTIITSTAWTFIMLLLLTAWICMAAGNDQLAVMLGFTACVLTGCAVVFSLRCAAARTRALIRSIHGLDGADAVGQLHSLT